MPEQSGSERYPVYPKAEPWEQAELANDKDQGNFGSDFVTASTGKDGGSPDDQINGGHAVPGSNFSGDNIAANAKDKFEQGDIPSNDINYFEFKK